jgi:hypothetical protein
MSFRRDLLLQAGLFDERYIENAVGEEEDAAFAIRRLGYRVHYDAQAWVIHLVSPAGGCRTASRDPGETPSFYRNKTYFALKNVAGGDFWRILLDTYRSRAWRRPAFLKRQSAFVSGIWQGWQAYRQAGWHLKRLPYTLGGKQ